MFDENHLKETLRKAFEDPDYYNVPTGIIRDDFTNVHGWWVRVTRDRAAFRKLFSDNKYGSIPEALKQAILYRHEILKNFPITLTRIHNRSLPLEPGKRIKRHEEKGRNRPYIYWRARWYNEKHEIKSKNFSILQHGEEGARLLALETAKKRHNKKPKLTKIPDPYLRNEYKKISRADVEIFSTINSPRLRSQNNNDNEKVINNNPFAFEGESKLSLHLIKERNKNIRKKKIEVFLNEHNRLYCELCNFNFIDNYPFLTTDIIEVHHIVPLASLSKSTKVNINDLMLLCSNCHLAIHQGDAEENLLIAMEYFEKNSKNKSDE